MLSPSARISQQDLNRLRKTLWQLATKYKKMETKIPLQLAKMGSYYAKGIAPYMTGATMKSISYNTTNGKEAMLFIDAGILKSHGTNRFRKKPQNYVIIMHRTKGAMGKGKHITSGDPTFMYTTRRYLKQVLGEKLRISLGKKI